MAASVIDLQLWSAILPSKVPDPNPKGEVTMLLAAWSSGDKTALDKMMPAGIRRVAPYRAARLEPVSRATRSSPRR